MAARTRERSGNWPGVRLHVVTGKGGTGKTTVAAALALALAAGGRRTLVVEVEGRQGLAGLFDTPPLAYEERRVAVASGGGEVLALAVDAEQALMEYLEMFYKLGRAGKGLRRLGAVDFATTIAPGLRDVLLIGKVYEAVRRRTGGRPVYDAVVLDAPPTGRISRFLNVNSEVAGLAGVGPIRSQAESIMALLRSGRSTIHLVSILEEMPVQETVDAAAELAEVDLPVGGLVVNMIREPVLAPAQLSAARRSRLPRRALSAGLREAGVSVGAATVTALLDETYEHAARLALEEEGRARLRELDRPTYELAVIPDGIDLGALYELGGSLTEQGMA